MRFELHDIAAAFSLLTRLPVPVDHARAGARGAGAAWAFPIVGALLGLFAGGLGWAALSLGVSAGMAAIFVIAVQVVITGAMHEDGLADMADGMGGFTVEKRLEIMKDSRIGAYGAIALALALLARHVGVSEMAAGDLPWAMAALGAGSRALMVAIMAWLPNARKSGLSASAGTPEAWPALGIGLAVCMLAFGWGGFWIFTGMALAVALVALIAKARFGGQTGDILGASQQSAEIVGLALL
ncbi:MAG: adenosylcobinamide-GDP ribazoletransferase [Rhodobacteraceae bacterium]|nr:adenosylcobinamide-GDP ribazoletransferase [Paracoccaceae bacterium]